MRGTGTVTSKAPLKQTKKTRSELTEEQRQ
jgi:hypothetical protein